MILYRFITESNTIAEYDIFCHHTHSVALPEISTALPW